MNLKESLRCKFVHIQTIYDLEILDVSWKKNATVIQPR